MRSGTVAALDSASRLVRRRRARGTLPPGPALPAAAQLALWVARPYALLDHCRARYGPTFSLRFPGMPRIVSYTD